MSTFTVVYALTRDLRFGESVPHHECYHHIARVTAPSIESAIARCRRDAISGFDFQLLTVVAGEPELLAVGSKSLVHAFVDGSRGELLALAIAWLHNIEELLRNVPKLEAP